MMFLEHLSDSLLHKEKSWIKSEEATEVGKAYKLWHWVSDRMDEVIRSLIHDISQEDGSVTCSKLE